MMEYQTIWRHRTDSEWLGVTPGVELHRVSPWNTWCCGSGNRYRAWCSREELGAPLPSWWAKGEVFSSIFYDSHLCLQRWWFQYQETPFQWGCHERPGEHLPFRSVLEHLLITNRHAEDAVKKSQSAFNICLPLSVSVLCEGCFTNTCLDCPFKLLSSILFSSSAGKLD